MPTGIYLRSAEHKKKISEIMKRRKITWRDKISKTLKELAKNPEYRKRMSKIAKKGWKEGKLKPYLYILGKRLPEEHKKRISEALKGRRHLAETRKKLSEATKKQWKEGRIRPSFLGKHHSEETKRKIGKRLKLAMAIPEIRKKVSEGTKKAMKNPKVREKIRLARLKQKLPVIDTSIETKVKEWLDKKGINYIHPFNLGDKFQCDFYIPALNLIVECDGSYWHSRPDMIKRDKAKDAYAKKCRFHLIRLKEEDIKRGLIFIT